MSVLFSVEKGLRFYDIMENSGFQAVWIAARDSEEEPWTMSEEECMHQYNTCGPIPGHFRNTPNAETQQEAPAQPAKKPPRKRGPRRPRRKAPLPCGLWILKKPKPRPAPLVVVDPAEAETLVASSSQLLEAQWEAPPRVAAAPSWPLAPGGVPADRSTHRYVTPDVMFESPSKHDDHDLTCMDSMPILAEPNVQQREAEAEGAWLPDEVNNILSSHGAVCVINHDAMLK